MTALLALLLLASPAPAAEARETAVFAGGSEESPTYEQVSSGATGHAESVRVTYDPARVNYDDLLEYFWRHVDPLTADAQFCDRGRQYRTAIFPLNEAQRSSAEASKKKLESSGRLDGPVVTEIVPGARFYPAEPRHQDYYKRNSLRYRLYRASCGRDRRLKEIWDAKRRAQ